MSEHPTLGQLERYYKRSLSSTEIKRTYDHLHECTVCYQRYNREFNIGDADDPVTILPLELDEETEPVHLPPAKLTAYIEGTLDSRGRTIATAHLRFCRQCTQQVTELKTQKDRLQHSSTPIPHVTDRSLPFRSFARPRPAYAILTVIIVSIAVMVSAIYWQRRGTTQISHNEPVTQPTPVASVNPIEPGVLPQVFSPRTQPEDVPAGDMNEGRKGKTSPKKHLPRHSDPENKTTPGSNKQILFALNNGGRQVRIDTQNRVMGLPTLGSAESEVITAALLKQEITDVRIPPEHAVKSLEVRSAANEDARSGSPSDKPSVTLLSPIGTYIGDVYATLKWKPVKGADSLTLSVVDQRFEPVVPSTEVASGATQFRIPVALTPGMTYTWQVKASAGGKEVKSSSEIRTAARFTVLDRQRLDQVQRTKRRYANSHLVLGVLYAREGLLDDAERELQELLKANPKSAVAQKLLRGLQSRRTPRTP